MDKMTPRERLLTTIRGGIPDRTPATIHQWQGYHYTRFMHAQNDMEAFRMVGLDAVTYPWACYKPTPAPDWVVTSTEKPVNEGMVEISHGINTPGGMLTEKMIRSEYTVTTTEYLVKQPEDIYLIQKYLPSSEIDVDAARSVLAGVGQDGILRSGTNGPQGSPWQDACCYCGTMNMIYKAHDEPDWTHEFLEILLHKKLEFYRKNIAPLKGVFSMIETGGGAASNNVISPKMFREFCLPYDIRQHDFIHDIDPDIAISYHTCGGMMQLLDMIPQNGCDFSETLSPPGCGGDIVDHRDEIVVKNSLGAKVKLMGGFNQSEVLEYGNRDQIYTEVERCFSTYGVGGGYIMMPSDHFFLAPKANLEHYANAVREICLY